MNMRCCVRSQKNIKDIEFMRRNLSSGVIAAIISTMLAVALILVCGIGSSWFTNSDVATRGV